ncbi:MAG TPA: DinB family protein [Acidimicrobiia bacterium]|nr:DinB family protein [Acidimicrobiia bacterium]
MDQRVFGYLERIEAAGAKLLALAHPVPGLTTADPDSGERWEDLQVWGHITEFVPYWIDQIGGVVVTYQGEPVPFGRTKADEGRLAGIESGRSSDFEVHRQSLQTHLSELDEFLRSLQTSDFGSQGLHARLGPMTLEHMIENYLVGHLEEHAEQLERISLGQ